MRKRRYANYKALAIYSDDEEGFFCQICQEQHGNSLVWFDWEIPRHLKDPHGFDLNKTERMRRIIGWNDKFEKSYKENINRKIRPIPPIDFGKKKTKKEVEKDKKRRLMEREAQREAIS
jgi:hypothetical protein